MALMLEDGNGLNQFDFFSFKIKLSLEWVQAKPNL